MKDKNKKPPRFAVWFLRRMSHEKDRDSLIDDLEFEFRELAEKKSRLFTNLWYISHFLRAMPELLLGLIYWRFTMSKNYLKIAFRNLSKYKTYSIINILGLGVGIACTIFIAVYVFDELSYDRYHENSDRIYRVAFSDFYSGIYTSTPLAEAMVKDFPEVESATRLYHSGFPVIRYEDKVFSEERFCWVDSNFFDIFSFEFIRGNSKTSLKQPNTVVITESMAEKYFGSKNPVGELLNYDNRRDFRVTGVIKDLPLNSHFHFDFFASFLSTRLSQSTYWGNFSVVTYIQLYPGQDWKALNKKFPDHILQTYQIPLLQKYLSTTLEVAQENSKNFKYFLQPLTDIHLHSHLDREIEKNSDITYVYLLSIMAFISIFIASFNFINLSTAQSANRAKEVGIRKAIGSIRRQFIYQFLLESIVISLMAVLLAVLIVYLAVPFFNDFIGKQLQFDIFKNLWILPSSIIFAVFIGVISGLYPAFVLASYKPTTVLRGELRMGIKGKNMRKTLVILQFGMSIFLFISTFVLYGQLTFMLDKNVGYNKDRLLIIHKVDDIRNDIESFKNDLLANPNILNVTNSGTIPSYQQGSSNLYSKELGKDSFYAITTVWCDYDFIDTYQMKLVAGSFYTRKKVSENRMIVVINEAAVKIFKMENPIGSELVIASNKMSLNVIGVVKDFHYESLQNEIKPMVFALYPDGQSGRYVTCRINTQNMSEVIDSMQKTWSNYAGRQAFEYTFLSDDFANLYQSEERTSKLFVLFSILATSVACFGLFGLIAFITRQKTKEIGIRKVMGARVTSILSIFMKEVAVWIFVSNIIAWPFAYFLMKQWLQNFAYRINLNVWNFILSGLVALAIALLTVSYQTIKAAKTNPIDSLKYE